MAFLESFGGFNPNMMSLNDLASISPMKDAAMGIYGSALSPEMKEQMMPMGMMNRDGQAFMGQPQMQAPQQQPMPEQGMSKMDMMRLGNQAIGQMQGMMGKGMQMQQPTQQIVRDSNQFRFAGMQQNPQQQMAQMLRRR